MGLFSNKRELAALKSHIDHIDSEFIHLKRCYDAQKNTMEHQKEQIETLKTRAMLAETILANILARDINCIIGADYYLDRLEEIKQSDPDVGPITH